MTSLIGEYFKIFLLMKRCETISKISQNFPKFPKLELGIWRPNTPACLVSNYNLFVWMEWKEGLRSAEQLSITDWRGDNGGLTRFL